ncbi:hypothetical protein BC831DRAFT_403890 [Entophlyctis helioformis]|nr:hypothetical protein BC831DRAFT_403890 [Entophlyctis helioformis]
MPANADAPVAGFLKTLPEWSNSDRRSFLFAEFPHERTPENSTSYDSALAFWTRTVTEATRQRLLLEQAAAGAGEATTAAAATGHGPSGSAVALGTYGLQHVFGHESGAVPLGLDTVLGHMHATGTLVRLQDFLAATDTASSSSSGSITVSTAASTAVATVGWMLNALVATPVRWTVAQVIGSSSKGLTERHETMVVKPLVQAAADAILAHLTSSMLYSTDLLIDEQGFQDLCKESNALGTGAQAVSALDVQILLHHFKQQNWAVFESATSSEDQSSRTTIKFRKPAGASAQRQTLAISKADRGIVTIKATIRKLTAQVSEMEAKMLSLTEQARQAAASKLKHRALNALRQRKNLEQSCNQRAASLETLDMVLHKIQSAESDSEVCTKAASAQDHRHAN